MKTKMHSMTQKMTAKITFVYLPMHPIRLPGKNEVVFPVCQGGFLQK